MTDSNEEEYTTRPSESNKNDSKSSSGTKNKNNF